jgi:hypothetical protein
MYHQPLLKHLNFRAQDCRPGILIFILGGMDSDQVWERSLRTLLTLWVPVKHDLHLDTKYTLALSQLSFSFYLST